MVGAVLTGGASRRMGTDKALVLVDGVAMAARVARALLVGGASPVVAIGGNEDALVSLGLSVIPDLHPGSGPLGGIVTALAWAGGLGASHVVVSACDHPYLDPPTVESLITARTAPDVDAAVLTGPDGRHALVLALRFATASVAADAAWQAGERSVHALLDRLRAVPVPPGDPDALHDVDAF